MKLSDESLLEEICSVSEEVGRPPTMSEMSNLSKYSASVYPKRFGSWNNALELAGFERRKSGEIPKDKHGSTDSELIEEIKNLGDEKGRAPSMSEMDETGNFSRKAYKLRFGSWNNALKRAGFDRRDACGSSEFTEKIDREELLEEIHRLEGVVGRTPSYSEMWKEGKHDPSTYVERFGSWNNAIEEAGYETREIGFIGSGPDHYAWKGTRSYYGPKWSARKAEVRERDNGQCRICGLRKEDNGRKVSVHHIRPRSEFIQEAEGEYENVDWEECDDPSNLICLCIEHHRGGVDGMWTDLDHDEWEDKCRKYYNGR